MYYPTISRQQGGFTLVELIVVILIIGVLAAVAFPRLNLLGYQQTGFFQQALAAVRYAQQQAIGSGCHVEVDIQPGGCFLSWTGDPGSPCPTGGTAIVNPARGVNNFCADSTPAGSPTALFEFDNIGRPVPNTDQIITIGDRNIAVEAETGYAREI